MKLRNQLGNDPQIAVQAIVVENKYFNASGCHFLRFVLQFFYGEKFRLPPMFLSYKFSHALSERIKMHFL